MTHADKRSVATDALETLGRCPIPENSGRDAIHLAVEPVIAAERLYPGQHVGLTDDHEALARIDKKVGIVDPFVDGSVAAGERFWLVVYPRRITSLRHVWTHPDFEGEGSEPVDRAASEAWLRDFIAASDCPDYDTVIAAAIGDPVEIVDSEYGDEAYRIDNYGDGDTYLYFAGRDAHSPIPPEFWDHVEIVTGRTVPPDRRANYFSCSC